MSLKFKLLTLFFILIAAPMPAAAGIYKIGLLPLRGSVRPVEVAKGAKEAEHCVKYT